MSEWSTDPSVWDPAGHGRSWLLWHVGPLGLAITLATFLPVSSHGILLLVALPFWGQSAAEDSPWPLLGK